jgi:hypothetical protein
LFREVHGSNFSRLIFGIKPLSSYRLSQPALRLMHFAKHSSIQYSNLVVFWAFYLSVNTVMAQLLQVEIGIKARKLITNFFLIGKVS